MQSEDKVNVLLVDDYPENLLALEAILDKLGQNLVKANSGEEALRCLLNQDFAVILLDVQMPGMDGFETASLIRQRQRSRHTPIIFLTAFSTSDSLVFKGYSLGAVDYLLKPIEADILTSKVSVFVDLFKKTAEVKRQALQLVAMNGELRKSEERFRSLSACSPVGIFLTDITGHCTYTNPSFQALSGLTFEESAGEGWSLAIHPEDRNSVLTEWSASTRQGLVYSNELRFQTPECLVRWVHVRSSPMLSDKGELLGHVCTVEDITERKQAEEARAQIIREQEARLQAESANRMKDEFLATLSHELRTPLNSILGWARLLRTRTFDQSTTTKALETIERNAKLQAELIDDILDVSRIIRGKLRLNICTVNLVPILEAAVDAVRPTAEAKGITVQFSLISSTEDLEVLSTQTEVSNSETLQDSEGDSAESSQEANSQYIIPGDPDRLQQVVWNLLSNALKFTPEGGEIEVNLSLVSGHPSSAESLGLGMKNGYAQIQVRDTGIGISKEFLPYVFDRFRQADGTTTREHGGLGLGLAIVRHLVELHSGTVHATSEGEGKGSTFTVQLPLLGSKKLGEETQEGLESDCSEPSESRLSFTHVSLNGNNTAENSHQQEAIPLSLNSSKNSTTSSADSRRSTNSTDDSLKPQTLSGLRVLVVEDEPDARDLMAMLFKEQGVEVFTVGSAAEAIETLTQWQPNVLVSDIGLPNEDGYTLIRRVRSLEADQGGQIPAVALTAYVREQDYQRAILAGYQMHICKPVDTTQLLSAVAKLTGRSEQEEVSSHEAK